MSNFEIFSDGERHKPILPDILRPNLDIVFIGAAASYPAAATGRYYAGNRNRFWQLLHQSGLTSERLLPEEDHRVFEFCIGLTGLHKNLVSHANHLLPDMTELERDTLERKLRRHAPRIICFNGRDVYKLFHGEDCVDWGQQPELLCGAYQFVVHSTSGRADRWAIDRLQLFRELREFRDQIRSVRAGLGDG